jgi:trans-aconitate 2-methyltransferase
MAFVHTWDPRLYLTYGDERGRPFLDLVARVRAEQPSTVVDLGCGPGTLTRLLKERWPSADVLGLDSSAEMVAAADRSAGVRFQVTDLRDWRPERPVDVVVSNATLQWVPGHLELLPTLVGQVAPGGWFAFSVPGNFDQPSHTIRAELAAAPPYAEHLADLPSPSSHDPETYLERLLDLGCEVDAWEATYLHVLPGEDAVFTWVSGTGARPTLEALPDGVRQPFEAELKERLRSAYPSTRHGTVLPFRRVFAVARAGAR